jgi:hypothetical protein
MTIQRHHVGPPHVVRPSIHNGTIYLAGRSPTTPERRRGRPDAADPRRDRSAARGVRQRQDEDPVGADIPRRHRGLRGDELDVDAWVPAGHTPARATVESKLAAPKFRVEIKVIAAA